MSNWHGDCTWPTYSSFLEGEAPNALRYFGRKAEKVGPENQTWKRRVASLILIVSGAFWVLFGIGELFTGTSTPTNVIQILLLGGTILLTLTVAYRWSGFGGALLVVEGLLPLLATVLWAQSLVVFLVLGLPPLAAGILFIVQWHQDRQAEYYFWR